MALLAFAGFETNNTAEVSLIHGTVVSTSPRTGSYCLELSSDDEAFAYGFNLSIPSSQEIYFQLPIHRLGWFDCTDDQPFVQWRDYTNNILGGFWYKVNDFTLDVYVGNKTTKVGSTSSGLAYNAWTLIEGRILINDTGGVIQIKVNDTLEVDFSGDTKPGTTTQISSIRVGNFVHGTTTTRYGRYDDVVVCDTSGSYMNGWIGGVKVNRLTADGVGNYSQWTPTPAGTTNFMCIDDSTPSMSDYVQATATGNKDSYTFGSLPETVNQVTALVTRYWGAGWNSAIKRLHRIGSTDYLAPTGITISTAFSFVQDVSYINPATSSAWTKSVIDGIEAGMEKI